MWLLRPIGAGLFVFAGVMAAVGVAGALGGGGHWLTGPAIILAGAVLTVAAMYFFNPKGSNALGLLSAEEHLADLARRDLIVDTSFQTTRAFGVEPEVMASGRVIKTWFRDGFAAEDGTILTGISFDDPKRSRAGAG